MINICDILYSICEDEHVYDKNFDLIESGLMDSFAFIELFSILEDNGIIIYPTRIDKNSLRTSGKIEKLIKEYNK
jgi:acyl carrier protein